MSIKTLVVDDDPEEILLIEKGFAGTEFDITSFTSAQDGLNAIETELPDLLILDVEMPGMDGLKMLDEIRKHQSKSELKVLFYSNHAHPIDIMNGFLSGANLYLPKSTRLSELIEACRELIVRPV